MNRLMSFLLGIMVGIVGLHTAQNYHVVRSYQGLHLIPKKVSNLSDVYVDIRKFDVEDWTRHKLLAAAILTSDHKALMVDTAKERLQESVNAILEAVTPP